jgi:hypothetical protein
LNREDLNNPVCTAIHPVTVVVLALGYKMFMNWLASGEAPAEALQSAENTG